MCYLPLCFQYTNSEYTDEVKLEKTPQKPKVGKGPLIACLLLKLISIFLFIFILNFQFLSEIVSFVHQITPGKKLYSIVFLFNEENNSYST